VSARCLEVDLKERRGIMGSMNKASTEQQKVKAQMVEIVRAAFALVSAG
jgi:hypothetical protein